MGEDGVLNHMNKTAIVILTYNNLQYNKDCIASIRKYTESGTYELVVVDNNSTDGTREWLKTQTDIKLQLNDENVGFPKGCNMGIALAEKDSDILLLNNDTIVTPKWLENLRLCLYSSDTIGAAGAVSNHDENLQGVDFHYETLDEMLPLAEKNNISDSGRWEEKLILIGYCVLLKRDVLNQVGPLDEIYSPGYVEDNDLSLRIVSAGYKLMLCHDCFIHHYLGSKFRENPNQFFPVLYANRAKFKAKWGFETYVSDEIKYSELTIFDEPDQFKPINVLDIGCGLGATLLKVKKKYPNAQLYGLEPNPAVCAVAKHVAHTVTNPVDAFPLDFPENFFDDIIIGNILETVDDPQAYISELRRYLKTDGWVIATFRNAMHFPIVRSLLNGNWFFRKNDGAAAGKRLFTLNDITELFARCGYRGPYIFHWFSTPTDEERQFVEKLCAAGDEKRDFMYTTHSFSVRFQK